VQPALASYIRKSDHSPLDNPLRQLTELKLMTGGGGELFPELSGIMLASEASG
jgi:hypothetical protein